MYVVKRLMGTNFMSHRNIDLDFSGKKIILVQAAPASGGDGLSGDRSNATGKSTIVEAVSWAIFEKSLRKLGARLKPKSIVSRYQENPMSLGLELEWTEKGKELMFTRTLNLDGDKTAKVYENGELKKFDKKTDLNKAIQEWIGIDFDMLLSRFLTPDNTAFITLTPSDRYRILSGLQTFDWDRVWTGTGKLAKKAKDEVDRLTSDMADMQVLKARLEGAAEVAILQKKHALDTLKTVEDRERVLGAEVAKLEKELAPLAASLTGAKAEKETGYKAYKELLESLSTLQQGREAANAKLSGLTAEKGKLESSLEGLESQWRTSSETLKEVVGRIGVLKGELGDADTGALAAAALEAKESRELHYREFKELSDMLVKLGERKEAAVGTDHRGPLEKQFRSIGDIVCPKCDSVLNPKAIVDKMVALREVETGGKVAEIDGAIKMLVPKMEKASKILSKAQEKADAAEAESIKVSARLGALSEELAKLSKEADRLKITVEGYAPARETAETAIAKLASDIEETNLLVQKLTVACDLEKPEVEKALKGWENSQERYEEANAAHSGLSGTLRMKIIDHKQVVAEVAALKEKAGTDCEKEIARVRAELQKLTDDERVNGELLADQASAYAAYTIAQTGSQASSPARLASMNKIVPYLSDSVTRILSFIAGKEQRIEFSVQGKEIAIESPDLDLDMMSTGEKRSFDIAVAGTLQELAMRTSRNQLGFFVGDELFDGLDAERIRNSVAFLRSLDIPQMFIITHSDKAKDILEALPEVSVLEVENSGGIASAKFRD